MNVAEIKERYFIDAMNEKRRNFFAMKKPDSIGSKKRFPEFLSEFWISYSVPGENGVPHSYAFTVKAETKHDALKMLEKKHGKVKVLQVQEKKPSHTPSEVLKWR